MSGYSVGVTDNFSKLVAGLFYRERIFGMWMKAANNSFPASMRFRSIIRILHIGESKDKFRS